MTSHLCEVTPRIYENGFTPFVKWIEFVTSALRRILRPLQILAASQQRDADISLTLHRTSRKPKVRIRPRQGAHISLTTLFAACSNGSQAAIDAGTLMAPMRR
jgi:hypothetical protein